MWPNDGGSMHIVSAICPNDGSNKHRVRALWPNDGDNTHALRALTEQLTYPCSVTVDTVGSCK